MIFDVLENISKYNAIPKAVIDFISSLTDDMAEGRYEIAGGIYANVETYRTKNEEDAYPEAHRKYIDIQLLLRGIERIDYANINDLKKHCDYNPEKDIIFYERLSEMTGSFILNGKNFAILYPQDAHAPQISVSKLHDYVKKVVIKIAVDSL